MQNRHSHSRVKLCNHYLTGFRFKSAHTITHTQNTSTHTRSNTNYTHTHLYANLSTARCFNEIIWFCLAPMHDRVVCGAKFQKFVLFKLCWASPLKCFKENTSSEFVVSGAHVNHTSSTNFRLRYLSLSGALNQLTHNAEKPIM